MDAFQNSETSLRQIAVLLGVNPAGKSIQQFLAEAAALPAVPEPRAAALEQRVAELERKYVLLLRGCFCAGLPLGELADDVS